MQSFWIINAESHCAQKTVEEGRRRLNLDKVALPAQFGRFDCLFPRSQAEYEEVEPLVFARGCDDPIIDVHRRS